MRTFPVMLLFCVALVGAIEITDVKAEGGDTLGNVVENLGVGNLVGGIPGILNQVLSLLNNLLNGHPRMVLVLQKNPTLLALILSHPALLQLLLTNPNLLPAIIENPSLLPTILAGLGIMPLSNNVPCPNPYCSHCASCLPPQFPPCNPCLL